MFRFLRRGPSPEERVEIMEYLKQVRPLVESLDREFDTWMQAATSHGGQLDLSRDPDGQHAAVYLWRVTDAAQNFVGHEPVKAAARYWESFSLCLEARGAAADLFKEAANRAGVADPAATIGAANRKLAESERERTRANAALKDLESRLGSS